MATLVMTHTLSSSASSSPDLELFTPPPSHATLRQVPDVFVIPPEEEHHENPPFCYFDAAMESKKSLSIAPDIDALDAALGMCQQTDNQAPVFHRSMNASQDTVVMPKRSDGREEIPAAAQSSRGGLLDEDVVEVVRVSRKNGVSNTPAGKKDSMKKSMSFRARATLAFRSIKNVGKGSRRGIPEDWSTSGGAGSQHNAIPVTEDGVIPQPSLKLTRKPSNLKQLFMAPTVKSPTPDVPTSPTSPTSTESWSAISRPSIAADEANVQFPSSGGPEGQPTLNEKRSFVRRISARNIFALSSPTKPNVSSPLKEVVTPSPSKRESVMSSRTTASTGLSKADTAEDVFGSVASNNRPHSFHASMSLASTTTPSSSTLPSPAETETTPQNADSSFELNLDPLNFDSLHFDPEEFVLHLDDN
ncbi:hypothetical protein BC629DRAFT_1588151 [Irpex lacteus]|nr:hypothetical protein BC629DRAFT_1588151 [Irpex lacteus]